MAPVISSAVPTPAHKLKRPTPAGIQTNGAHATPASKSSPSPSMSSKKPPSAVAKQQTPTSATVNGVNGNGANRTNLARSRRDMATQNVGRGQRNNAGSSGSASLAADASVPQSVEPRQASK